MSCGKSDEDLLTLVEEELFDVEMRASTGSLCAAWEEKASDRASHSPISPWQETDGQSATTKKTASLQPTFLKFAHINPRHPFLHASHLQELPQQCLLRWECVLPTGAWQLRVQLLSVWRSTQITHMLLYANAHLKTFQSPNPYRHRIISFSQMYCI